MDGLLCQELLFDSGSIFGLDLKRDCYHTEDWSGFGSLVTFYGQRNVLTSV